MPSTPEEMLDSMIRNLKEKTGKALPEWIKLARASGESKHGEIVAHLKSRHGIGHGYANLIAQKTLEPKEGGSTGDLLAAQYAGPKAELKPIYDRLVAAVRKFGGDIEISPKKTYVSLRRKKQFALIQASTKDRLDVGINLKGTRPAGRLEASGSFNAMVTHRVRVSEVKQVDGELTGWLKKAYDAS